MAKAKPQTKLLWLQECNPCPKSNTGKHEFYAPVTTIGKWRSKWNLWLDKLGGEAKSIHRKVCPLCKSRKNVKIITIRERK